MEPDFSGWATRANLKCADGLTIKPNAFQHNDGIRVPLMWQHQHNQPNNVLGHAMLESRPEGVYAYGYLNNTDAGKMAKEMLQHGDINQLSIYANNLVKQGKDVMHGNIREVSLVLAGANPEAFIDFVNLAHGEDGESEEAWIFTGLDLEHSGLEEDEDENDGEDSNEELDTKEVLESLTDEQQEVVHGLLKDALAHANNSGGTVAQPTATASASQSSDKSIEDIFNSMSDEQKNVVYYMIGEALDEGDDHDGDSPVDTPLAQSGLANSEDFLAHIDSRIQEGFAEMSRNVFEQNGSSSSEKTTLTHDQLTAIFEEAQKPGSTLKDSFLSHADEYGITDINVLFPPEKLVNSSPEFLSRRMEWVQGVLTSVRKSPFSRIKSTVADITAEEARAKGYVKGNLKKSEIIKLLKRVTTPTTIYKKQKLDRDDIVDIVDLDVVAWLKTEMRIMLDEEIARAILIGDGRQPDDPDKINEDSIRPIAWDEDMYAHTVTVPSNTTPDGYIETILRSLVFYKGTGIPTLYTTNGVLTDMLLLKDKLGRRIYNNVAELAAALRVDSIVQVEAMESTPDLLAVIVNLVDYTVGADKGGEISMFDNFDIDYNQQKYLIETRISGALTKPKSALVLKQTAGTVVTPTMPVYDTATHTITIPTVVGVDYYDVTDITTETLLTAGAYVITKTTDIEARAQAGYEFAHNVDTDWVYAYTV